MLTRMTTETIKTALTITGQGIPDATFNVTFNNIDPKELATLMNIGGEDKERPAWDLIAVMRRIVNEWEAEYELSEKGFIDAESDRPGILAALLQGYNQSRQVKLVKN